MTAYKGPLNVIADGQGGSVIAVTLNPGDIPADGLTIDVSILQTPAGQQFGNILGLTVDAGNTNVTAGLLSITFAGGSNLTRAANGGTTQLYKVVGQCQRITLNNLSWSTGSLNVVLWNTSPPNELISNVNVSATITAGTVAISNSSIQVVPLNSTLSGTNRTNMLNGQLFNIIPHATNGTLRNITFQASNVQAFVTSGVIQVTLQTQGLILLYQWTFGVGPENQPTIGYSVSDLAFPFLQGIDITIAMIPSTIHMNSLWVLSCTLGTN